jgi:hypothetical protein
MDLQVAAVISCDERSRSNTPLVLVDGVDATGLICEFCLSLWSFPHEALLSESDDNRLRHPVS